MFDQSHAEELVKKVVPDGEIQKTVSYKNFYIVQVFSNDPEQGEFDSFYSVDQNTGMVSPFSMLESPDAEPVFDLFMKLQGQS